MHFIAGKSLESIGRTEEVSLLFRAKDSLSEGIVDMRVILSGGTGDSK